MTPEDVRLEVDRIASIAGDDEIAHIEEDDLHKAVLQSISDKTCSDPVECARIALTTSEIEFGRWYR